MQAIFVDRVERAYTARDGQERVHRGVNLSIDGVGTGEVRVSEDVYKSLAKARMGTPVRIVWTGSVFNGRLEARVAQILPGSAE